MNMPKLNRVRWSLVAVALAIAPEATQAQLVTWSGTAANGGWGAAGAFNGVTLSNGFSNDLLFAGAQLLSNTNTLTGGTATSLAFASTSGAFTLNGNALVLRGALSNSTANLQTINLPLQLTQVSTITPGLAGGGITINGVISNLSGSTGGISTSGPGVLTLNGTNTYTGNTTLNTSGTLVIGSTSAIGSGTLILGGGGYFDVTTGSSFTLVNNLRLSGGSGTFGGSGNLSMGALTFGSANRRITTLGTNSLTIASIDAATAGDSGNTFTKDGAGTLVVTGSAGANFQGGFVLGSGSVILGNSYALGSTTITNTNMAYVQGSVPLKIMAQWNGSNWVFTGTQSIELAGGWAFSGAGQRSSTNSIVGGTLTLSGPMSVSTHTLSLTGPGQTVVSATVTGAGGVSGTQTFLASPTAGGTVAISGVVQTGTFMTSGGGVVRLTNPNFLDAGARWSIGGIAAGLNTSPSFLNPTVDLVLSNSVTVFDNYTITGTNNVTFNGPFAITDIQRTGTNSLAGPAVLTYGGNVNLPAGGANSWVFATGSNARTVFSGTISGTTGGTFGLTFGGTNTSSVTVLSSANTFLTGSTTLGNGTYILGNKQALGNPTNVVVIQDSVTQNTIQASVNLTGTNAIANPLVLNRSTMTVSGSNGIEFAGGLTSNNTTTATVRNSLPAGQALTFSGGTTTMTLPLQTLGSGSTVFNQPFSGAGALTISSTGGVVVLAQASPNYSGAMSFSDYWGDMTLMVGHSQALGTGTITIGGGTFAALAPVTIANTANLGQTVGSAFFSGTNNITFSGSVNHQNSASYLNALATSATLAFSGMYVVPTGQSLGLNPNGNNTVFSGSISTSGTGASAAMAFTQNYSSSPTSGTISLLAVNTGTWSQINLNGGVSLVMGGTQALGTPAASGSISMVGFSSIAASEDMTGANKILYVLRADNTTAVFSGTNSMEFGAGLVRNNVSIAATVLVNNLPAGKRLVFSGTSNLSSGAATLVTTLRGSGSTDFAGTVTGSTGLSLNGPGTVVFSASNTYTGSTTVSGGVLLLNDTFALPGGLGSSGTNASLVLSGGVLGLGANDFTRALAATGAVTGSNQVSMVGGGGFAAYGANRAVNLGGAGAPVTWASGSFVGNGNTLVLGSPGADFTLDFQNPINLGTGTRTVRVDNGSATIDAILSGSLSNANGGFTKTGDGTLALTAASDYTGLTTVSGGVLQVGSGTSAAGSLGSSSGLVLSGAGVAVSRTDQFTQTFASTTLNAGASTATAGAANGLNLKVITRNAGATLDLSNTGTFYTSTTLSNGVVPGVTVGGTTWAATSGTTVGGLASYTAASSSASTGSNANVDVTSSQSPTGAAFSPNTVRFNSAAASTLTLPVGSGSNVVANGILVSANVGANASTITGGTVTGAAGADLVVIQNNTSGTLSIGSVVADNASATGLTKSGAGTLVLNGANAYTGATTVNAGTLRAGSAAAFGAGAPLSVNGGTVNLAGFNVTVGTLSGLSAGSITTSSGTVVLTASSAANSTYSGALSGALGLTKLGSGALTLGGTNTHTGGVAINAGTVIMGSTAALGSGTVSFGGGGLQAITGTYANPVSLGVTGTIDGSAVMTGSFSGAGGLAKIGTGNVTLGVANTYAGPTTISGGTLAAWSPASLSTGTVVFGGGGGSLALANPVITWANPTRLDASGTVSSGTTTRLTGIVSGVGNFTKVGAGGLVLAAANTYTGTTFATAGILNLANPDALGGGGTITFAGGTIQFSGSNRVDYASRIKSSASAVVIDTGTQTVTFAGVIDNTNTLGLTKRGVGTLVLAGANTYTGSTTIASGVLSLANATALSSGNIFFAGGTLQFTASNTVDYSARIKSAAAGSPVAIDTNGQTVTFASAVDSTNAGGLTKLGSGTLVLTAANTYTGTTMVNGGVLQIGNGSTSGTVVAGGTLVLGGGGLAVNRSDSFAQGFSALTLNAGASTLSLGASNGLATGTITRNLGATLDLSNTGTFYFGGTGIMSGTMLPGVTVGGTTWATIASGTTVSALTAYTTTATIGSTASSGSNANVDVTGNSSPTGAAFNTNSLRFNSAGAYTLTLPVGSGSSVAPAGGILVTANVGANASTITGGTISGTANSPLVVIQNNTAGALTIGSQIIGTALVKSGPGTLIITATTTYTGTTYINGGTLQISAPSFAGNAYSVLLNGGALQLGPGAAGAIMGNPISLATSGTIDTNGYSATFAGTVSSVNQALTGSNAYVGLTKLGSGTLTLTGFLAYTGTTAINAGTLQIGNGGAIAVLNPNGPPVPGPLANGSVVTGSAGATLLFNRTDSYGGDVTNTIGGGIGVTVNAGSLVLSASNSYTGPTTVTAGRMTIAGPGWINQSNGVTITGAEADFRYNAGAALTAPITFTQGTLSGTGAIGTAVTVGANDVISPGNSPGIQPYTQGLTFGPNGTYLWEVNNWTGVPGTNYDQVAVSGSALVITATPGSPFTIRIAGLTGTNTAGAVPGFAPGTTGASFPIATSAAGITGFSPSNFAIDGTSAFTTNNTIPAGAGFWVSQSGTSVFLNYAPSAVYTLSATASATAIRVGDSSTLTATITSSTATVTNPDSLAYAGLALSGAGALSSTSGTLAGGQSSSPTVVYSGSASGQFTFSPSVTSGSNVNLGTTATASSTTAVTVTVYNPAAANPLASPVSLGSVRVGDTFGTGTLSIWNTGTALTAYQEGLSGTGASAAGDASVNGSFANLYTGGTTQAITVGLGNANMATAGVKSGSVTLGFRSTGTSSSSGATGLSALTLTSQTIAISGTVWNAAAANSIATPVSLGSVYVNGAFGTSALVVSNTAPVGSYTEGLNASFGASSSGASNNSGTIVNLAGGGTNSTFMTVGLANASTSAAGVVSGTQVILLQTSGSNSGLPDGNLASQTLTITGTVWNPAAVNQITTPVGIGSIRVGGTFGTAALLITNTATPGDYTEKLGASASATTGQATTSGSVVLLAGGSSSSALSVGLGGNTFTGTAGQKNGTVTVGFTSTGGPGTAVITSQTIAVSGTVWNAAAPNSISGTYSLGTVLVSSTLTKNLLVANTAPNDGYSEKLDAGFGTLSGVTGSGTVSLLAVSQTSSAMSIYLSSGVAGTGTGSAQVNFWTNGTDTSGLAAASLAPQTVFVTGTFLDQALASFSGTTTLTTLTLDFGSVNIGDTAPNKTFDLWNLMQTAGYTADLALLSFPGTGDTGVLTTNLVTFNNLAAGTSSSPAFLASFDTTTGGDFESVYTLQFKSATNNTVYSGDTTQTLTLTLKGSVIVVPEPAAAVLALVGVGGIAALRRWRRRTRLARAA